MREVSLEIDDVGLTVNLDNPAEVLAMILHVHPAVEAGTGDKQLRVHFGRDGELFLVFELENEDWHETGDLPRFHIHTVVSV
jgi:hypothetical protein